MPEPPYDSNGMYTATPENAVDLTHVSVPSGTGIR